MAKTDKGFLKSAALRFGLHAGGIAVLAGGLAYAAWPRVYDQLYSVPLGIGQEQVFKSVAFGVVVGAVVGGLLAALAPKR